MAVNVDPLVSPPPEEVPLKDAPLVRVIAQIRFPEILSIEQRSFVAPFQEALREAYPVLRLDQTPGLLVRPAGVAAKPMVAWRFNDIDGNWRVSLTSEFLALETTNYESRSDFLARFRVALEALSEYFDPKQVDRLGVRYIDRITGSAVDEISALVQPEVRGISGTLAASHADHSLTETLFAVEDARVVARWGQLPPRGTVDPAAIEPAEEKSWILDLDMFSSNATPFVVDRVVEDARRYAERIYAIFRWAVTDDFLRRYGGNLG
jgi:uncharacterized protein (TIGR04255 family)